MILLLSAGGIPAAGQSGEGGGLADPALRSLTSHSHRFVVTSAYSADNLHWATWAERVTDKVSIWLGMDPPFQRGYPLRVLVREDEGRGDGAIRLERDYEFGHLVQRMIVINPDRLTEGQAVESLVTLLLERCIHFAMPLDPQRHTAPAVPEWMSVGLARNMYSELRARNHRVVLDRWLDQQGFPMARVFELHTIPPEADFERAVSAMFMDWLRSQHRDYGLARRMLRDLAAGKDLSVEWLVATVPPYESVRELEQWWDLWIAGHLRVRAPAAGITMRDLSELRELQAVRLDARDDEQSIQLTLRELIHYRDEEWIPSLALRMGWEARSMSIGQPEAFREVALLYAEFFDALRKRRSRWRSERADHRRLLQLLEEANAAFVALAETLAEGP